MTPEIIAGVEVYGLKEKITSADIVDRFYSYLDDKSAKSLDVRVGDKIRQRQELLSPNERYLEVVVRRSAYDSFVLKQTKTGVGFAEWIKIHVDVMNRCLKKATPPFEMKAVLRRILVIDDNMAKKFYPFSIDTDCVWAIADDYRASGGGKFYEIRHENDKTFIGIPPEKAPFDQPEISPYLAHLMRENIDHRDRDIYPRGSMWKWISSKECP